MNRCADCGAKCCLFLILPAATTLTRAREGLLPYDYYRTAANSPDLEFYFSLRLGVVFHRKGFSLCHDTPVFALDSRRFGRRWLAAAPCQMVAPDGRCRIYDKRPMTCRNFTRENARFYVVPNGCIMDPGGMGEDVSQAVKAGRWLLRTTFGCACCGGRDRLAPCEACRRLTCWTCRDHDDICDDCREDDDV